MNEPIVEIELRFSKRDLLTMENRVAFIVWETICRGRLDDFLVLEDFTLENDYVCRLREKPADVRYCLEQLGLRKEKEELLLESISNTV